MGSTTMGGKHHGGHILDQVAYMRRKASARRVAPSEPWVEAQFEQVDTEPDLWGHTDRVMVWRPDVFPPGGETTGMVKCRGCERFTPPQCVGSSGHCDDCRMGAMPKSMQHRLQGSTSAINMAKWRAGVRRGEAVFEGGI